MFDSHWRDEEPFFVAAEAMLQRLPREIAGIASGESFILVHGGDVFHRSKETGRVNGVALRFFMSVLAIPGCQAIYIIQGNHDVKKETGSALDFFLGIDNRLKIIKKPELIPLWDGKYLYALPHMPAYALENFKGITSYGDAEFHAPYLGDNIDNVAVTVCHFGDETAGDFFKQADISFLPGIMCNGHIHKRVSDHYPGSIGITRRDEVNKISYLRVFENGLDKYADIAISCAFNYLKINFGDDVLKSYESMEVKPYGSLIVDVQGHDDESAALLWFDEQKKSLSIPAFLGSVYPDEKQSNGEYELDDSSESKKFDIKVIFAEFCKEKGVDRNVQGKIEALL
jgi:hypothetical protein